MRMNNQRMNIRNAYMVSSTDEIRNGMDTQDEFGKACLQEMLNECITHNVDNFGDTPAFSSQDEYWDNRVDELRERMTNDPNCGNP